MVVGCRAGIPGLQYSVSCFFLIIQVPVFVPEKMATQYLLKYAIIEFAAARMPGLNGCKRGEKQNKNYAVLRMPVINAIVMDNTVVLYCPSIVPAVGVNPAF